MLDIDWRRFWSGANELVTEWTGRLVCTNITDGSHSDRFFWDATYVCGVGERKIKSARNHSEPLPEGRRAACVEHSRVFIRRLRQFNRYDVVSEDWQRPRKDIDGE